MKTALITTKTPEDYLKEPYTRNVIPEVDGTFSAEILEFPGCYSFGDTVEEAYRNLEEAAKNWIEACLEQKQNIPEPTGHNEYSGKVALRLPANLHRAAVRMAARENTTLNQFLVDAVASKVGATTYHRQLLQEVKEMLLDRDKTALTVSRSQMNFIFIERPRQIAVGNVEWQPSGGLTIGTYQM